MLMRTAKPVTAVIAGFLAGAPLTTISIGAAWASDNCLPAPTEQAPAGSHWYYRTDRANQRECWYIREAPAGLAQSVPANPLPLARLISPQAITTGQVSSGDARAEVAAPTAEQSPSHDDDAPAAMASETAPSEDHSPPRMSPEETHRPMLMAALAFAGIVGSVLFKLGGLQRSRRVRSRKRRGAIWASADRNRRTASAFPGKDELPRRRELTRDVDRAGQLKARSREILSQLSER
jgi:hypothetical protein